MSKTLEAVIVLAKCTQAHKTYGMRAEKTASGGWLINWAFPIKDDVAKREGYDRTTIKGNIQFSEEYPGCPYCNQTPVTLCSCGHLNCTHTKNNVLKCEWCGSEGIIGDYTGEAIIEGMDA